MAQRCSRQSRLLFLLVLVTGLAVGSVGCTRGRGVPLRDARAVLLPAPMRETELRAAITRALSSAQFTADSETPGIIVAESNRGRRRLRVRIVYSPTQYQLAYLDSDGYGAQVAEDGARVIHPSFERAMRNLSRAIDDEIGRPTREANQAVEQQRRHVVAVIEARNRGAAQAREAAERERERNRQAELERERIRVEGRRPVVMAQEPRVVVVREPSAPALVYAQPAYARPAYAQPVAQGNAQPASQGTVQAREQSTASSPPDCRAVLLETRHAASQLGYCNGAEPYCAAALLRAGNDASQLGYCRGVEPRCAVAMMRRGDQPSQLGYCRP
jgi:hypothetical protein